MRLIALVSLVMVAFAANSVLTRAALEGTQTGPKSFAALRLAAGALVLGCLVLASQGVRALAPSRAALPDNTDV